MDEVPCGTQDKVTQQFGCKVMEKAVSHAHREHSRGRGDNDIARSLQSNKRQFVTMTEQEFRSTRSARGGTGMGGGRWGDGSLMR